MSKKKEEAKSVKIKKAEKKDTTKKTKTVAEKKTTRTVKVDKPKEKDIPKKAKTTKEKKTTLEEVKPIKKKVVSKKESVKEEKVIKKEEKKKEVKTKKKIDKGSLSQKEQKILKVLSKILYIITKVIKVCTMIIVPILAIVAILIPMVFSKIEVNGNIIKVDDLRIVMKDDNVTASLGEKTYLLGDNIENLDKVIDYLNENTMLKMTISIELALIFTIITAIINIYLFGYAEKLFGNFVKGDTPFTEENNVCIHKIGRIMIISLIVAVVFEGILSIYTENVFTLHCTSYSITAIMIVYILYYIFTYATKLQSKSSDKIYN